MNSPLAAELLRLALELPAGDRLALATELLKSVEGAEDDDWSDAWVGELDRRTAAMERGEEPLELWETVETCVRAQLPRR